MVGSIPTAATKCATDNPVRGIFIGKTLIVVYVIVAYLLVGFLTASVMVKYRLDDCDASDFVFVLFLWPLFAVLGLPIMFFERIVAPRWRQYLKFLTKDHHK